MPLKPDELCDFVKHYLQRIIAGTPDSDCGPTRITVTVVHGIVLVQHANVIGGDAPPTPTGPMAAAARRLMENFEVECPVCGARLTKAFAEHFDCRSGMPLGLRCAFSVALADI